MNPEGFRAYIGMGANLNDPVEQLRQARNALSALPQCRLLGVSRIYRTTPVGPADQPDFFNAVVVLRSGLSAMGLLEQLQAIEKQQGRVRDGERWGPRSLDLDLLLFADQVLDEPLLQVPHPRMHERGFVLVPLADVAPADLSIPGQGGLDELLARCDKSGVWRMDDESL